jgi:hypothetical protein
MEPVAAHPGKQAGVRRPLAGAFPDQRPFKANPLFRIEEIDSQQNVLTERSDSVAVGFWWQGRDLLWNFTQNYNEPKHLPLRQLQ